MSSPFDIAKSISNSIENEVSNGKIKEKDINKFMLMQIFSGFDDTVLQADWFNEHSRIDGKMLYHCLHGTIKPKRSRYSKWIKPVKDRDDVEAYMEENEVGRETARMCLELEDKIKGIK